MSNSIGSSSFSGIQSVNSYQSSQQSRELFSNDKFAVQHEGGEDFTFQDKQSGDSHRCQGDFGQSGLQGPAHGQDKLIDQIVKKVLEKIGEKLGIDLSGLLDGGSQTPPGEMQPHEGGSVSGIGSSVGFPSLNPRTEFLRQLAQQEREQAGQKPMFGDVLGLGNQQNVKDHNAIERAFDPFGIF